MRLPFNATCDIYGGPNSLLAPGELVGTFQCRLVPADGISESGSYAPDSVAYLTIEDYQPIGSWSTPTLSADASKSDRIAIPSGGELNYWVVYTEEIVWRDQPRYWRATIALLAAAPIIARSIEWSNDALFGIGNTSISWSVDGLFAFGGSVAGCHVCPLSPTQYSVAWSGSGYLAPFDGSPPLVLDFIVGSQPACDWVYGNVSTGILNMDTAIGSNRNIQGGSLSGGACAYDPPGTFACLGSNTFTLSLGSPGDFPSTIVVTPV